MKILHSFLVPTFTGFELHTWVSICISMSEVSHRSYLGKFFRVRVSLALATCLFGVRDTSDSLDEVGIGRVVCGGVCSGRCLSALVAVIDSPMTASGGNSGHLDFWGRSAPQVGLSSGVPSILRDLIYERKRLSHSYRGGLPHEEQRLNGRKDQKHSGPLLTDVASSLFGQHKVDPEEHAPVREIAQSEDHNISFMASVRLILTGP